MCDGAKLRPGFSKIRAAGPLQPTSKHLGDSADRGARADMPTVRLTQAEWRQQNPCGYRSAMYDVFAVALDLRCPHRKCRRPLAPHVKGVGAFQLERKFRIDLETILPRHHLLQTVKHCRL